MRKIRMKVRGRVQGVGFRFMTKNLADQLGITGAVWNEYDGSVGIEAIGTAERIALFIDRIKISPTPAGRVSEIDVTDDPDLPEAKKFSIF